MISFTTVKNSFPHHTHTPPTALKRQLSERPGGDGSANANSTLTISAQNRRIAQLENQLALVQRNFDSEKQQYADMEQVSRHCTLSFSDFIAV